MPEPQQVQQVLALLGVALQACIVVVGVLWVTARFSPAAEHLLDRTALALGDSALPLAAVIATVAMLGSLYLSEVAEYVPCKLCWYQRILMYPLALILVPAAIRNDLRVAGYAIWLAAIGAAIAAYHYQLELFPGQSGAVCDLEVPCTVRWFVEFGYISIPMLALTAFAGAIAMLGLARRRERLRRIG